MKLTMLAGLIVTAVTCVIVIRSNNSDSVVTVGMGKVGLISVKSNGEERLASGEFKIHQVILRRPSGETYSGVVAGNMRIDEAKGKWIGTYPWGEVSAVYSAANNRFNVTIVTKNTSADTIQSVWYEPFVMRFPDKLVEYDGSIPLLVNSVGGPAVLRVSNSKESLVVVSDNFSKPLQLGFPWANDKPASTTFPFSVNTGRVKSYPDSYPVVEREVSAGASDEFQISLRFGPTKATLMELGGDAFSNYARVFPQKLNWTDRRPIGSIFLASADTNWANNPRGWLSDPRVDVTTADGRKALREKMLAVADTSIGIMKQMNAQGAVTWDIEGQQFQRTISYVGDPRLYAKVAPEMEEIADEYFKRFRDANLKTGVCIRPQEFRKNTDGTVSQVAQTDPAALVSLLIDKIRFAKDRWGVQLVYLNSNVNSTDANPIAPEILQKVAEAFPDVLLIPEHSTFRYYAFSAPYKELRQGYTSTAEDIRAAYPKAFTFISTADGPLDLYNKALASAMKRGDSVIYRTWYPDPQNEKVKTLFAR